MIQCVIFNVRLGQCVAFYPVDAPEYLMLVDCGHESDFHPIDFLIENTDDLPKDRAGKVILGNLTLTNYDHDHFSGLPYLMTKTKLKTTRFPKNLSCDDLIDLKDEMTDALTAVLDIKDGYTNSAQNHNPPYVIKTFHLTKDELAADITITTNHLSQIVFFSYGGKTICISGDLEKPSWELMLKKAKVCELLQQTNIFFASHHGRDNGYYDFIFTYCEPECIIISDKEIVHGTQESMSQKYAKHVIGDGIQFKSGSASNKRKVLSTRSDGHILINLHPNGDSEYISL